MAYVPTFQLRLVRERSVRYNKKITSGDSAAEVAREMLCDSPVERMVVIYLDGQCRLIGAEVVSQGGISTASIRPAEVFRGALVACANCIVLAHNHPSGSLTPSDDDIMMTIHCREAGKMLGIPVLDHVIVGDGRCFSMQNAGMAGL